MFPKSFAKMVASGGCNRAQQVTVTMRQSCQKGLSKKIAFVDVAEQGIQGVYRI